jgi:hypothetical protein
MNWVKRTSTLSLRLLHAKYVNLVAVVEDQGLNQGVFDASISVAVRLERSVDEDEQVRQLLAQKGAFSASALWNVCGTRVGNARVATSSPTGTDRN